MNEPKKLPHNTVMRWGVTSGDTGSIEMLEGLNAPWPKLPYVGDLLTVPFLVDRETQQPVPVRVLELRELLKMDPPTIVVLVGRPH